MKKFIVAGIAAAAFCGAPALAADLPTKAPAYTPAPAPMFSWTGFYIGANTGDFAFNSYHTTGAAGSNFFNPYGGGRWGYGGQVGFNYQMGPVVVGVETSGMWRQGTTYTNPCANPAFSCNLTSPNHQYDVRGRIGLVAVERLLIYGTGGWSWIGNVNGNTNNGTVFPGSVGNLTGTVWGGGIEWALPGNWILGGEYLQTNYGTHNATYDVVYSVPVNTWEARARLSYLFNWGGKAPVPVAAKY
jgi:outer membrane immunogenic protein